MRKILLSTALVAVPCVAWAQNTATQVSLAPVENAILTLAGTAIMGVGTWALAKVAAWAHSKGLEVNTANYDTALNNALAGAISTAQAAIAENGWDHVSTNNGIVADAANLAIAKFPDALKAVGITPTLGDPKTLALVQQALAARLPAAMAVAAASPATPATPLQAAQIAAVGAGSGLVVVSPKPAP